MGGWVGGAEERERDRYMNRDRSIQANEYEDEERETTETLR